MVITGVIFRGLQENLCSQLEVSKQRCQHALHSALARHWLGTPWSYLTISQVIKFLHKQEGRELLKAGRIERKVVEKLCKLPAAQVPLQKGKRPLPR